MNFGDSDALISQIYSAAAGRQRWEPVLENIANACGARAAQLLAVSPSRTTDSSTKAFFSHVAGEVPPQSHLEYLRTYQHIDPRAQRILATRIGDWYHCHEAVSDEQVAVSKFYQDFLIPFGLRYLSATPVFNDGSMAVMLCVLRGVGKPPLEAVALQWLDSLKPHFAEAMAIYRHLDALHVQSLAGQAILDRLHHSVMLVDAAQGLRFANAAGRAAIASELALRAVDGQLQAVDPSDDRALAEALNVLGVARGDADLPERGFVRLRGTSAFQKFGLSLSALRPAQTGGAFGHLPLAMLVLHDGNQIGPCDPFILQEMFGLTPAEADVAVLLTQGVAVAEIARRRQVSITTVRSQVSGLKAKTETKREADLVRRLLALPHAFSEC